MTNRCVCAVAFAVSLGIWFFNLYACSRVTPSGPLEGEYALLGTSLALNFLPTVFVCVGAAMMSAGYLRVYNLAPQIRPSESISVVTTVVS